MTRNRLTRAVAVFTSLALLVAACGSDEAADSASEPAPNEVAGEAEPAKEPSAAADEDDAADGDSASENGGAEIVMPASLSSEWLGSYELADDAFGTMVTVDVDGDTPIHRVERPAGS